MFEWGGGEKGGSVMIFRRKFFVSVPKNFAGEPFSAVLQKFPVAKKFMDKSGGGSIKSFRRKFSVSQCRKFP